MMKKKDDLRSQRMAEKQKRFLDAFRQFGTIRDACKATGIGRHNHYGWLVTDEEYRKEFAGADADFCDALEGELYRRGVEGIDEPLYFRGQKTGDTVKRYSDTLLLAALRARRPEKFDSNFDGVVEHHGPPIHFTLKLGEKSLRPEARAPKPPPIKLDRFLRPIAPPKMIEGQTVKTGEIGGLSQTARTPDAAPDAKTSPPTPPMLADAALQKSVDSGK
jgi:hypothetical protein